VANCPLDCTISPTTCTDGTAPGLCSVVNLGKKCDSNLALVTDATCNQASTDCSDGTKNGVCSSVNINKKCVNGVLTADASCNVTPPSKDILTQIGEFFSGVVNGILRFLGLAK
jgi:hypothetical protein